MNESEVVDYIMKTFPKVERTTAYGYEMFFYSSDRKLSFATLISSDYDYDHVSNLSRPGVFRLNIGVSKQTFQSLFGTDEVLARDYDFTALDVIMPHPEYAQYHFVCVLSPSDETFEEVRPLLAEAYDIAARRYARQNKTARPTPVKKFRIGTSLGRASPAGWDLALMNGPRPGRNKVDCQKGRPPTGASTLRKQGLGTTCLDSRLCLGEEREQRGVE